MTEFSTFRTAMDRLFDQSFGRLPQLRGGEDLGPTSLGLDVLENGNEFVVKAAIPGVDPKDVEISIDDDVLTIRGSFEKAEEQQEETYIRRELRYGNFQRALRLPPLVDVEKAQASFEHGMLKLTLPKKAEARSRSLKITPQGVIEGQRDPGQSNGATSHQ
jgi:HSP20 family protein